ncbi:MAG: hypothetical protein LBN08_02925 [Lactobacillales bacterium]|jgi:hypothetical protein|nr:hypothetical protein [Lactobacillales bacterium]
MLFKKKVKEISHEEKMQIVDETAATMIGAVTTSDSAAISANVRAVVFPKYAKQLAKVIQDVHPTDAPEEFFSDFQARHGFTDTFMWEVKYSYENN